jgi:hypothetical protein
MPHAFKHINSISCIIKSLAKGRCHDLWNNPCRYVPMSQRNLLPHFQCISSWREMFLHRIGTYLQNYNVSSYIHHQGSTMFLWNVTIRLPEYSVKTQKMTFNTADTYIQIQLNLRNQNFVFCYTQLLDITNPRH